MIIVASFYQHSQSFLLGDEGSVSRSGCVVLGLLNAFPDVEGL